MRKFEIGKIYEFDYDHFWHVNDEWYIVLKDRDTGLTTLQGFTHTGLMFRVPLLPFQMSWDDIDTAPGWNPYRCRVIGFHADKLTGSETSFPIMIQDPDFVNGQLYGRTEPDTPVPFVAVAPYGHPGGEDSWLLKDPVTGFDNYVIKTADFGNTPPQDPGDTIPMYPVVMENGTVQFRTAAQYRRGRETLPLTEIFPEGRETICTIDSADNLRYVTVTLPDVSQPLRIPCPVNGTMPKVGETVCVKCVGVKDGWPLLEWTGKYAKGDATVDALPVELWARDGKPANVEYVASLVRPDGANEADVDKQLGEVVMRLLASLMNDVGGTICIGVKDDGTVCGIEDEGKDLMHDSEDAESYPPTSEGMKAKISNTIERKLCAPAADLVEIGFKRETNTQHLVCVLAVRPSLMDVPIYTKTGFLYTRGCGRVQKLQGEDAARFVVNRLRRLDSMRTNPASGTSETAECLQ